jgi:cysteinyl-tRNA synthetase
MANYWLHNGFLQVEGEKMSKSTGNFVTIRDLLGDWPGEVVRFNMLRSHYRQPMDWTVAGLEESSRALATFYSGLPAPQHGSALPPAVEEALTDDLNTPKAITELFALHRRGDAAALAASLAALGFTGDLADPRSAEVDVAAAERLISARAVARKSKNFAEADRIRLQLDAMGVQLKDAKDPKTGELVTTWEVKR